MEFNYLVHSSLKYPLVNRLVLTFHEPLRALFACYLIIFTKLYLPVLVWNSGDHAILFSEYLPMLLTYSINIITACMTRCMNVDEAKKVCKNRSRCRSVVSAYSHGKKAWVYVCIITANVRFDGTKKLSSVQTLNNSGWYTQIQMGRGKGKMLI